MNKVSGYLIEKYTDMRDAYTCRRLCEEAEACSLELQVVGMEDLSVDAGGVFFCGKKLPRRDFVLLRSKDHRVAEIAKRIGRCVYNPPEPYLSYLDKSFQLSHLSSGAFTKPDYFTGTGQVSYATAADRLGPTFVLKGLEGSQGDQVFLISSEEELEQARGKFHDPDKIWLFEEYIRESCGRDVRLFMIRGKTVGAMIRKSRGDFRANVYLGAEVRGIAVDENLKKIGEDVFRQSGLDFCGIDLLFGRHGFVFCEINVMPGIRGMEQASGRNIARLILRMVAEDFGTQPAFDDLTETERSSCEKTAVDPSQADDYEEAVSDLYRSYLRAEPYHDYNEPDRMRRYPWLLSDRLKVPADPSQPVILVTGSKGKGAMATILSELLRDSLSPVGLVTSPHIREFTERFRMDGEPIGKKRFSDIYQSLRPYLRRTEETLMPQAGISPVGIECLIARTWFQEEKTKAQIFECGKGVQWDDTSMIPHDYALIGPIFAEHTRELGKTVTEIATDKAHIMTVQTRLCVSGRQSPEVTRILDLRASLTNTKLLILGRDFEVEDVQVNSSGTAFTLNGVSYQIPLCGSFQADNAACALMLAAAVLYRSAACADFSKALLNVRWPGRCEILSRDPLIVFDCCISKSSGRQLAGTLRQIAGSGQWEIVLCIPSDKDYCGVAEALFPAAFRMILTQVCSPHYRFDPEKQCRMLQKKGMKAECIKDPGDAVSSLYGQRRLLCGTTAFAEYVYGSTLF